MPRVPAAAEREVMTEGTHTLVIERWRPLRLNDMLYRNRYSVARRKRADKHLIAIEAVRQGVPKAAGPRRVSIHVVLSGRQKAADPDAYWKSLNDGLTSCGLLVDDSSRYCTLGPVTYERGEVTRTIITLEDC